MKKAVIVLVAIGLIGGCARVSVQGSKEPIKLDISMRLDIYQHVEKDIDAIEGIVSGSQDKATAPDKQSFLSFFVTGAYAQEALGPGVEQAAMRRKARVSQLYDLEGKGVIGENKMGLLEVRGSLPDASARQLIDAENSDRMEIYKAVAAKNAVSLEEAQALYAKRLQRDAPAGAPIEVSDGAGGASRWEIKQ